MVTSGFSGLGYQIIWTQQSALWLGHEAAAVLAVVCAFFFGLTLGARFIGRRIAQSRAPARWYAACELVIGGWALALIFLMYPAAELVLRLIGSEPSAAWQWFVAFVAAMLLFLPATCAMGATLPAMERWLTQNQPHLVNIPMLYAANTIGALLGVLGTAFYLIPEFGLATSTTVCAALSILCALASLRIAQALPASPPSVEGSAPSSLSRSRRLCATLFVTGCLGIGYEVVAVRVLSLVAENTVYTFAILLTIYLVGTALGAAIYATLISKRILQSRNHAEEHLSLGAAQTDRLLRLMTAACVVGLVCLSLSLPINKSVIAAFGQSVASALFAETAIAMAAFFIPTLAMGALFSHLSSKAAQTGVDFSTALAVNTAGAAIAPLIFGVVLVPLVGAKAVIFIIAVSYLVLSSGAWRLRRLAVIAASLVAVGAFTPSLRITDIPPDGRLLSYREGALAAVSVVADANNVATLRINNRQQEGSSATLYADARQALLPALLHPGPKRAMFLGLGTGVTASVASDEKSLTVDAIELLPEVVEASREFRRRLADPTQPANSSLNIVVADARRYIRTATPKYDLIVADNFHPARSGSGSLYTREHFSAVRQRLSPDGIFCQWLPLHQLDLPTLRVIVRTFIDVYPNGWAVLSTNSLETPVVGLVGRADDLVFDRNLLAARMTNIDSRRRPAEFGFADEMALFGSFIAGPTAMRHWAAGAPLNTDDHPIVTYLAPRVTYAPDSLPRDRVNTLLAALSVRPDDVLSSSDTQFAARLAAYWTARNRFMDIGRNVQPVADPEKMLSQIREPLLSILRTSPDFRPAYDPLIRLASALWDTDRDRARQLLIDLDRVNPDRADARTVLRELSATR